MMRQDEFNAAEQAMQLLADNGIDELVEAVRTLLNEAMRIELSQVLNARPHERTKETHGHSNGYKPKTFATMVGTIRFDIPQVRAMASSLPVSVRARIAKRAGAEDRHRRVYVKGV